MAPSSRVTRSTDAAALAAVAAQRQALDGSRSLSILLNKRSEAEEPDLPEIDGAADKENPLAVCEARWCWSTSFLLLFTRAQFSTRLQYVNAIYSYYYRIEGATAVSPTYMTTQTDINDKSAPASRVVSPAPPALYACSHFLRAASVRAILVDWLVEVHLKFKLVPETLFLTVNLIDRYLAAAPVTRKNLQLVGVTAMLLASKYEEIWAPEVRDFVYISDKAYTREQILACEKGMLNTLGFHLTVPTPFQFLTRLLKAGACDKEATLLAQYLMELALPDYACLRFKASQLAAGAVYCAHRVTGVTAGWTTSLARHARCAEADLQPVAHALARLQRKAACAAASAAAGTPTNALTAVYKKYSAPKYCEVAKLPPVEGYGEDAAMAA